MVNFIAPIGIEVWTLSMKVSLRSACWCMVIASLSISLVVLFVKEREASYRLQHEEGPRSFLRALQRALDEDFPQGWTLEKDDTGKLFVRPKASGAINRSGIRQAD